MTKASDKARSLLNIAVIDQAHQCEFIAESRTLLKTLADEVNQLEELFCIAEQIAHLHNEGRIMTAQTVDDDVDWFSYLDIAVTNYRNHLKIEEIEAKHALGDDHG